MEVIKLGIEAVKEDATKKELEERFSRVDGLR